MGSLKMKSEHLIILYVIAAMMYGFMQVFHIHLRVLDSFFVMLCGLCVIVSLASIVKILADNRE